jgi:hypothetical protein
MFCVYVIRSTTTSIRVTLIYFYRLDYITLMEAVVIGLCCWYSLLQKNSNSFTRVKRLGKVKSRCNMQLESNSTRSTKYCWKNTVEPSARMTIVAVEQMPVCLLGSSYVCNREYYYTNLVSEV